MREAALQSKVEKWLSTQEGLVSVNIHGGGWCAKGVPDLIVCLNGRFIAFELKVDENGMSSAQRLWKKRIERAGGHHFAPRTLEEVQAIVEKERKL